MKSFVLIGKASQVFKLLALKAKYDTAHRLESRTKLASG